MNDIILKSKIAQTATVIFLHGLGDTGYGWSSQFQEMISPHIKYLFPNAPIISVTLNAGSKMPSWFDLYGLSMIEKEDEIGIKEAAYSNKEIENGIPSKRIILGGFSQGGALALYSGFTYKKPLAGIIALSAWLPLHKSFPQELSAENKDIPIFQAHGKMDNVVNYHFGQRTHDEIKKFNPNIQLHSYPIEHRSDEKEMEDVKKFISEKLP
ncbi:unnamed protein product [Gordionus sp. m RMFG-2023]